MTSLSLWPGLRRGALAMALGALSPWSAAAPGAHGPNGEHLDAPASNAAQPATAQPRFEARTESFELVGTFASGELSMLIDRFETNEPVLNAQVEVESGSLKAKAAFRADHGDYAVQDKAMMALLAKPATHALVITVLAGQESDLVDATLVVAAAEQADESAHGHAHAGDAQAGAHDHGHGLSTRANWIGAAVLAALAVLALFLLRRRGSAWGDQEGKRS
jgi:hypothetical protein